MGVYGVGHAPSEHVSIEFYIKTAQLIRQRTHPKGHLSDGWISFVDSPRSYAR